MAALPLASLAAAAAPHATHAWGSCLPFRHNGGRTERSGRLSLVLPTGAAVLALPLIPAVRHRRARGLRLARVTRRLRTPAPVLSSVMHQDLRDEHIGSGFQEEQMHSLHWTPEPSSYSKYLTPPERFSSSHWFEAIKSWPKSSTLKQIRHPLYSMTGVALLTCIAHCCFGMPGLPTMAAHTLLGSGLSLLLVFRTNTAYQRFQEGWHIWNDILDLCRDISNAISLYKEEVGWRRLFIIRSSVQAFPYVMQKHVRATSTQSTQQIEELLEAVYESGHSGSAGFVREMPTENKPLKIIKRLLAVVKSVENHGDTFTNRERVWIMTMVTSLSHTVGRCERLVHTPVPREYARHTSRFLSVWIFTLPLALVSSLGWWTVPSVYIIAWSLLGILEIGHSLEDPFRRSIELTPICDAISMDCERALQLEYPV